MRSTFTCEAPGTECWECGGDVEVGEQYIMIDEDPEISTGIYHPECIEMLDGLEDEDEGED